MLPAFHYDMFGSKFLRILKLSLNIALLHVLAIDLVDFVRCGVNIVYDTTHYIIICTLKER